VILAGKSSLWFSLSLWLLLLACCSLASPLPLLLLLSCSLRLRQLTHSPPCLSHLARYPSSRSSRLHLALLQPSSPCSSCSLLPFDSVVHFCVLFNSRTGQRPPCMRLTGGKAGMQSLNVIAQLHKKHIILHNTVDEFNESELANKRVNWPIAWLLKTADPYCQDQRDIPTFDSNDLFNTLIRDFVDVRNDAFRLERFFQRLRSNIHSGGTPIVDRVQDALRHALDPDGNVSSATTPPAPSAPTDSVNVPFATTRRTAPEPDTIFGQYGLAYRDMYDRSNATEAVFEHYVMAPMFFPLFTLFQPQCNRSSATSTLQPDWAFLTNRRSGHRWLCSETNIDHSDTKDATAIFCHLQDAINGMVSKSRPGSMTMRSEFAIGLRTFFHNGVTNMELSLLTFEHTTDTSSSTSRSRQPKWHYYVFPAIEMDASLINGNPVLNPARRLIATLVLVGTLIHLTHHDQLRLGPREPTTHHLPPTIAGDGGGGGGGDQQPPQDDTIEHLDVSEQAALSSFVLLPERPLPRADIHIVSRSSKTVVYCLEEPAACHVASQSSDAPQLSSTSAQAPRPLDLAPNRAPMPRAIKVTKKLAEAAVEVAALHRLRGLKRVPPLLECFRLASSDDPFAEPQHQAHQRPEPAVAQSRVAIVTPFIRSPRSVREFRDNEQAFKRIVRRLLRVLHECHVRRVVHGDVRVANILVDSAKLDVTLIDFGFATIDSRKSLIGNRNSSAEDVRQVALVTLAVMCGITYGSQDYSHLLRFEWSRFDFGMLLQCDNRASSLAKWQLELVYLAIEWGRNCTKLSCSTMHEQLLAISQPQPLVPQPQVKPNSNGKIGRRR